MNTVSVDIKIPDGHEVEEVSIGWPGYNLSMDAAVGQMVVKTKAAKPFLINGVPSDWPEWLTCDWVAADDHGRVHGYNDVKPFLAQQFYACGRGTVHHGSLFGIDIKIPGPWEQSLRENPRRKK